MDKHGTLRSSYTLAQSESRLPPLITPLREINQRCIELLVSAARNLSHDQDCMPLVSAVRDRLVSVTPAAIQLIGRHPFLLVDLKFQDQQWWNSLILHSGATTRHSSWRRYFAKSAAIKLTRATLMLAWHLAQTQPEQAVIIFGIDLQLVALVCSLSLHQLDQIAEHHHQHLVPRWEDRPIVWKHLLDDAQRSNSDEDYAFNLHALQLIAGEYLALHGRSKSATKYAR